jgi:hypothetical protein
LPTPAGGPPSAGGGPPASGGPALAPGPGGAPGPAAVGASVFATSVDPPSSLFLPNRHPLRAITLSKQMMSRAAMGARRILTSSLSHEVIRAITRRSSLTSARTAAHLPSAPQPCAPSPLWEGRPLQDRAAGVALLSPLVRERRAAAVNGRGWNPSYNGAGLRCREVKFSEAGRLYPPRRHFMAVRGHRSSSTGSAQNRVPRFVEAQGGEPARKATAPPRRHSSRRGRRRSQNASTPHCWPSAPPLPECGQWLIAPARKHAATDAALLSFGACGVAGRCGSIRAYVLPGRGTMGWTETGRGGCARPADVRGTCRSGVAL